MIEIYLNFCVGPLLDILHEADQDEISYPYIPLTAEALTAEEVCL
jgi:hypothetical protein